MRAWIAVAVMTILLSTALMLGILYAIDPSFRQNSRSQPPEQIGTVYIKTDGSIEPTSAPISIVNNAPFTNKTRYNLTGNVRGNIISQRSDITIDGNGHTLLGNGSGIGIYCDGVYFQEIINMKIMNFSFGIETDFASGHISNNNITASNCGIRIKSSHGTVVEGTSIDDNSISNNEFGIIIEECTSTDFHTIFITSNDITGNSLTGICVNSSSYVDIRLNRLTDNFNGITLDSSDRNDIYWNSMTNNHCGISVRSSYDSTIYGNNFIDNTVQAYSESDSINSWDNQYNLNPKILADLFYVPQLGYPNGAYTASTLVNLTAEQNFVVSVTLNEPSEVFNETRVFVYIADPNGQVSERYLTYKVSTDKTQWLPDAQGWRGDATANVTGKYNITVSSDPPVSFSRLKIVSQRTIYEGNYWSDYTGTDANHDGIGDTLYEIGTNSVDHYPLMVPKEQ